MSFSPPPTDPSITAVFRRRQVTFEFFQTRDLGMAKILVRADKLAQLDAPVLVHGEPGTGKSLLAQAIHNGSTRARRPVRVLGSGDAAGRQIRERLFGSGGEPGLIDLCEGGTLILDEVQEWPDDVQVLFEQILDFREFPSPIDQSPRFVDVRLIVTASGVDTMASRCPDGVVPGLYHRLRGTEIQLPPLAARQPDIEFLATEFLARFARREGVRPAALSPEALQTVLERRWYGNLRELDQAMRAASISAGTSGLITCPDLPLPLEAPMRDHQMPYRLDRIEKWAYERALRAASGNRKQAITMLGVAPATFYRKARSFGLIEKRSRPLGGQTSSVDAVD
jgi:DNA-binding NtrC family response regulator